MSSCGASSCRFSAGSTPNEGCVHPAPSRCFCRRAFATGRLRPPRIPPPSPFPPRHGPLPPSPLGLFCSQRREQRQNRTRGGHGRGQGGGGVRRVGRQGAADGAHESAVGGPPRGGLARGGPRLDSPAVPLRWATLCWEGGQRPQGPAGACIAQRRGGGDAGGSRVFKARCESCQSEWKFLLQRRALNKDSWPGMWDISAAGHVAAGGRVLETAQRELWEELGLRFPRAAFQPLFTHRQRFQGEFHGKAFVNNEFNHVFLVSVVGSIPDEALRLQESEVAEVASFPVSGLRERLLQKDNGYMTYLNGLSGESAGVRLARPALTSRHPPPSSPPKCAPTPPRGLVSL